MYIQGFVIPVPAEKKDAYLAVADRFDSWLMEHGATEVVEAWEERVEDGKQTDFRRAVAAVEGEKIVFSWVIWPDRETAEAAEKAMEGDPIMAEMGEMPFDGKRMIWGCFAPILERGR
ncbi:DUF1428 domain-containing protein [Croceicoccus sp. Ery5]|uniref:DUF1428 domain-containing protein n=1 Tax=Croceicoccus sp. Ery5 TaxID=1703340 RepID=UPI001E48ACA5|nr:DUF1428 domain-containing protein [Croceicoccus sp. Ery5]